jgi:hypothetical protein
MLTDVDGDSGEGCSSSVDPVSSTLGARAGRYHVCRQVRSRSKGVDTCIARFIGSSHATRPSRHQPPVKQLCSTQPRTCSLPLTVLQKKCSRDHYCFQVPLPMTFRSVDVRYPGTGSHCDRSNCTKNALDCSTHQLAPLLSGACVWTIRTACLPGSSAVRLVGCQI